MISEESYLGERNILEVKNSFPVWGQEENHQSKDQAMVQ